MKTCAVCNTVVSDGPQCSNCNKQLDFACSGMTEAGWRRLGADRRAKWSCLSCKTSLTTKAPAPSPVPQCSRMPNTTRTPEPVLSPEPVHTPKLTTTPTPEPISVSEASTTKAASLDAILQEILKMQPHIASLPKLILDVNEIKQDLSNFKKTFEDTNNKVKDLDARIYTVENKVTEISHLQDIINALQSDLTKLQFELTTQESRSRLNNVEIKGVPYKKDENLFTILDDIGHQVKYTCPKSLVNHISRVPTYNSNEKNIIVGFTNRYVKEEFMAAARAEKLTTTDIGFQNTSRRIYINDHLSAEQKKLLTKVKCVARDKSYEFVWVKHGKIHLRKMLNVNSKPYIVRKEGDLNKIS